MYDFRKIEQKWQRFWAKEKIFEVVEDSGKPKFYVLDMFPYPSGAGLHVGHPLGYIASDVVARYRRLKGYNVLHPMGFDSFGLPAEQYAIQTGQKPATTTEKNIDRYRKQLSLLGLSYDWSREVRTSDPSYYKWTQWIFGKIYDCWYDLRLSRGRPIHLLEQEFEKRGNVEVQAFLEMPVETFDETAWQRFDADSKQEILSKYRLVTRNLSAVNWCPELRTVLSNDEVREGYSVRGNYPVYRKSLPQWSMAITAYAQRLLSTLDELDWPAGVKEMQRKWIGRSEGVELDFRLTRPDHKITVFTTRIDTIGGTTFLVVSPEFEGLENICTGDQVGKVLDFAERVQRQSERSRMSSADQAEGVPTGSHVTHPLTGDPIPVWVSSYVLGGYGTGAVMAVPSGDQRDYLFAKRYNLPIVPVYDTMDISAEADPTRTGHLINSGRYDGLQHQEGIKAMLEDFEAQGVARPKVNFKMRSAAFGRQRYWGEPIPIYFRNRVPYLLDERHLPLQLPEIENYKPGADANPPLSRAKDWVTPDAGRYPLELTTMPGWAGSSWYFLRYMDPHNKLAFVGEGNLNYWKEVDLYVGGAEHATGHLLYSRFWTMVLYDLGYIPSPHYAKKLVNQGMIQGTSWVIHRVKGQNIYVSQELKSGYETYPVYVEASLVQDGKLDVEGYRSLHPEAKGFEFLGQREGEFRAFAEVEKMSKSKLNVINPDEIVESHGADTLRMYELFLGPIEQSKPWGTHGIEGVFRFLNRFHDLFFKDETPWVDPTPATKAELKILHKLIRKVETDIESLSLNTSVSAFMIATNELVKLDCRKRDILIPMLIVLSPFAPHLCEELHERLGEEGSISLRRFPQVDQSYLEEHDYQYPVSINGKTRTKISLPLDMSQEKIRERIAGDEQVVRWLQGSPIRKIIIVRSRIINVVTTEAKKEKAQA